MGSRDQELSGTHAKSPQPRSLNLWSGAWAGALRGRRFLGAGLAEYVAFAAFRRICWMCFAPVFLVFEARSPLLGLETPRMEGLQSPSLYHRPL